MSNVMPSVLAYLQDNYPASKDVKSASAALGVNPNTVRGIFPRLVKSGDAERTSTGWYKAMKPRKPAENGAGGLHGHSTACG
jgi:predicted transcriptional regulator of viral defense system